MYVYLRHIRFRMDTADVIRKSLRPGDWAVSLDAYFHVGIHPQVRIWLLFHGGGQNFQCWSSSLLTQAEYLGFTINFSEVRSRAVSEIHLSENGVQYSRLDSQAERDKADFVVEEGSGFLGSVSCACRFAAVAAGYHGLYDRPVTFGKPSQAPSAEGFCSQIPTEFPEMVHSHPAQTVVYRSSEAVDRAGWAFRINADPSA